MQKAKQEDFVCNRLGLMPQSIISCLEVLNDILVCKPTVVSSVVLKDKGSTESSKKNVLNYVAHIIG